MFDVPPTPIWIKERKEGRRGREKGEREEKQEKTMIHWESHPVFTGACFDLNVLIEVRQTAFSLNSLAIL